MELWLRYRRKEPDFLRDFTALPELQRLQNVGMNCGCEYTAFPLFQGLQTYSRYTHSLGVARIVWDFTGDAAQTLSALFHDVATPAFAHSIDFLHGDHLRQESTEAGTEQILRASKSLAPLLARLGIDLEEISDYHRYPIADNESPRLSADRLEYTLGNALNYGFAPRETLQLWYDDLTVGENEDGEAELAFGTLELARAFGLAALRCSRVYVSPQDRYAMQMLAELLERAIGRGVLTEAELYGTEPEVIGRLQADPRSAEDWRRFCRLHQMVTDPAEAPEEKRRVIPAKKRMIDPLIAQKGRLSQLSLDFAASLRDFLEESQDGWLYAR